MQLFYHPAFDSYHCIYRTLLITDRYQPRVIELERMRIWDFYLVFPAETRRISFPSQMSVYKRTLPRNAYEELAEPHLIFTRMQPFQMQAYRSLSAFGLLSSEQLVKNRIVRTNKAIPSAIRSRFTEIGEPETYVLSLAGQFHSFPLYGKNGLKARTKLLEYKYDPV
jgi:hypothetical protein